jgi:hypothetical protein
MPFKAMTVDSSSVRTGGERSSFEESSRQQFFLKCLLDRSRQSLRLSVNIGTRPV